MRLHRRYAKSRRRPWPIAAPFGSSYCSIWALAFSRPSAASADSQALKADALDFIGDGSITLIGILALAWTARTRARVALAQGLFLGVLGLGVIGSAVWRSLNAVAPEAGLMGGIAVAALIVNIAAALVLMRFREGDAHVSAIWLFSRNDAIANVGVIIAAALVAWTGQAWPDLLVAAVIALIFLHSAYLIVRRATEELRAQHVSALGKAASNDATCFVRSN